jgi:hypothetical protein
MLVIMWLGACLLFSLAAKSNWCRLHQLDFVQSSQRCEVGAFAQACMVDNLILLDQVTSVTCADLILWNQVNEKSCFELVTNLSLEHSACLERADLILRNQVSTKRWAKLQPTWFQKIKSVSSTPTWFCEIKLAMWGECMCASLADNLILSN